MFSYRFGAALGSLAVAGYLLMRFGLLPPDSFIWGLFLVVVSCGGLLGGGLILALQHVMRGPRVLVPTLTGLLILTLPFVACYQREVRATPTFLAEADSIRGVVTGRNVFGNLLVFYRVDSSHGGRIVAEQKGPHDRLGPGDSIWVYRQREAPHRIDVWPPGPDLHATLRSLLWLWGVGGVLLAGYGPLLKRRLVRPDQT
jgi:hypothetical protein